VGNASGLGQGSYIKSALGHITVNGKIGQEVRIPNTDLFLKAGQMLQGVYVQVTGATPSVDFQTTLAPIDIAKDSNQDTGGHWATAQTVTTTAITKITNPTTVLRVKFTTAAVVYIVAA
jgi:hypothetical protein